MDAMLSKYQPIALSLFRFIIGLLLFQYGVAKILGFPVVPMFAKLPPLIQVAGWIELVLGALLLIGPPHIAESKSRVEHAAFLLRRNHITARTYCVAE